MSREDNIDNIEETKMVKREQLETKEVKRTNYSVMEQLCAKLTSYLQNENIAALEPLLQKLNATETPEKIAFVKLYLCPKVHGLRGVIRDQLVAGKVSVCDTTIDKCPISGGNV
jgi:hypothetical protein